MFALIHRSPLVDGINVSWPEVLEMDEGLVSAMLERINEQRQITMRYRSKQRGIF